jgi:hypothetical protein
MFDFGSILGSGSTRPQVPRAGHEYILEWKPALLTLATLGAYVRPWIAVDYPDVAPSVGRLEAEFFDPATWKPECPEPGVRQHAAGRRLLGRAARRPLLRRRDPRGRRQGTVRRPDAAAYVAEVLITRRDKVLRTWLTGVNPIVDPVLGADGVLTFRNAAVDAGIASPPAAYALEWHVFDNTSNTRSGPADERQVEEPRAAAPAQVLREREFVSVTIRTGHAEYPRWEEPVTVYFRRTEEGWQTVGIDR